MKERIQAQEKFVILYDTAKKCLLIIDHLFANLKYSTQRAEVAENTELNSAIIMEIYISALGLIDYFHRFHEVISAIPLIRKDHPRIKKLNSTLKQITDCRNYLQHIRNDLMNNNPIDFPILGTIMWINENRNYALFSNQHINDYSFTGIAYDTISDRFVCQYQLVVGKYIIMIDQVYSDIKTFWYWFEKSTVIEPPHIKAYAWEASILYSEFKKT